MLAAAIPMVLLGGFAAGFDLMVRAMLADVGDEVRLEQGRERISMIYSVNTLAGKIAAAFSIILSYGLLERVGYHTARGAVNTSQGMHNLELIYIIGPIVFVMLGGACVIGWRLDARKHGEIRAELERIDREIYETGQAPVIDTLEGPSVARPAPAAE
jgi:GPH family glycoside/pentoside/hexuronide:cation symporter